MMRHPHLSDDRLIEVCLDRAPAATEQQHLEGCDACRERRANLARLLADVSGVATAEADAVFTAERLGRQHARILLRVEQEGRPGRVISFPAGHGQGPATLRTRLGTRWIAGAAAAGLVIGLLAGHLAHELPPGVVSPRSQDGGPQASAILQTVSATTSEEEFLGRLELAIEGPNGFALRPLDDLTPLVWEVAAR